MSSAENVAGMAIFHVQIWARASCAQAERIIKSRQDQHENELQRLADEGLAGLGVADAYLARQADGYMMVMALHQLRTAANLYQENAPNEKSEQIAAAIVRFDNAVPDIKKMRDTLTHFDDYLQGVGRLHYANSLPSLEFTTESNLSASIDGGLAGTGLHSLTYKITISPDLPSFEVEVFQAGDAAFRLHNELTLVNWQDLEP